MQGILMTATFCHERPVQFRDTDLAGVVHFTAVLAMVEEAWHAWLGARGLAVHPAVAPDGEEPVGWPVVAVACDYRAPLRFGATAMVELEVGRAAARSLELMFRGRNRGGLVAEGRYTVAGACPNADGQWKTRPLPARLVERLAG